jgi:hypothetical protein
LPSHALRPVGLRHSAHPDPILQSSTTHEAPRNPEPTWHPTPPGCQLTLIVLDPSKRQEGHNNAGGALGVLLLPACIQYDENLAISRAHYWIGSHGSQVLIASAGCLNQVVKVSSCVMQGLQLLPGILKHIKHK